MLNFRLVWRSAFSLEWMLDARGNISRARVARLTRLWVGCPTVIFSYPLPFDNIMLQYCALLQYSVLLRPDFERICIIHLGPVSRKSRVKFTLKIQILLVLKAKKSNFKLTKQVELVCGLKATHHHSIDFDFKAPGPKSYRDFRETGPWVRRNAGARLRTSFSFGIVADLDFAVKIHWQNWTP